VRIAFVSPNLYVLSPASVADPHVVELGVPTLAGCLEAQGFRDLHHYDFSGPVFARERAAPGALALRTLSDASAVDRYLAGEDDELAPLLDTLCEVLGIEAAVLFGLSLGAAEPVPASVDALVALSLGLAYHLKRRFLGCKIVLGGHPLGDAPVLAALCERCSALDYAVVGQGEAALLRIVGHEGAGLPLVGGSVTARSAGHGFVLEEVRPSEPEPDESGRQARRRKKRLGRPPPFIPPAFDVAVLATHRHSCSALARTYRLNAATEALLTPLHPQPVLVLPLMFVVGCTGACIYCSEGAARVEHHEPREVVRAIAQLSERYETRYFHFLNTNLNAEPAYADAFCSELRAAKLDILWSDCFNLRSLDERRLERLRQSGLIRMATGVECPSDRMLAYLHKGLTTAKAAKVLRAAHTLGIWNHCLLITGAPGETDATLVEYEDFLDATADCIDAYSVSPFYLPGGSALAAQPERYGIRRVAMDAPALAQTLAFDEVGGLAWPEKQKQIARSHASVIQAIRRNKGPERRIGVLDLDLLFLLYGSLGAQQKSRIGDIYAQASIQRPQAPSGSSDSAHAHPVGTTIEVAAWARAVLDGFGNDALQVTFGEFRLAAAAARGADALAFTLEGPGASRLELVLMKRMVERRHFCVVGPFGLDYRRETPVDTPQKDIAVRALARRIAALVAALA